MISRIKTYLILISTVIAIIATGYGLYSKVRADKLAIEKANLEDELFVKTTESTTYKNKLGQEVVKTITYTKNIKTLKRQMKSDSNLLDETERKLVKLYNTLDIKDKQLISMTSINGTSTGGGVFNTIEIDTTYNIDTNFINVPTIKYFDDGWIKIKVKEDSITYSDIIDINVFSAKRRVPRTFFIWKLFKMTKVIDKDMVEVISNNPHSKLKVKKLKIN